MKDKIETVMAPDGDSESYIKLKKLRMELKWLFHHKDLLASSHKNVMSKDGEDGV